jgi:hypothetical protein
MFWTVISLVCSGFIYGVSVFVTQKLFFIYKKPYLIGTLSIIRFLLLGKFFYIILKSNQIHPILLVALFLVAYWLTILLFKELMYARS